MSALTPHIRVLRSEGAELIKQSQNTHADAVEAAKDRTGEADIQFTVALLLARLGQVKLYAADALDAEERKRLNAAGLAPRDMADEVEQLKSEHPLTSRQTEEGKP